MERIYSADELVEQLKRVLILIIMERIYSGTRIEKES